MSTTAEQTLEQLAYRLMEEWERPLPADAPFEERTWDAKFIRLAKVAEAYAHSRITSLAEEAEREAAELRQESKLFNGDVTALVHGIHELKATAAWLRQKAEERGGNISIRRPA